ncbi:MAG: hypothetical protein M1825_004088 [Sarcosagium campestre]|nr:MAG: hypothetical protein M1825_004088 [Sarcosagium campestre]
MPSPEINRGLGAEKIGDVAGELRTHREGKDGSSILKGKPELGVGDLEITTSPDIIQGQPELGVGDLEKTTSPDINHGSTAIAIEGARGETRIYYQAKDGSIHERCGQGPAASGNSYKTTKCIVPAGIARLNTPLAVCTWGETHAGRFNEIRLYYISKDDGLREVECNDFSDRWLLGIFNAKKYKVAPGSMLLYATCLPNTVNPGSPRVGFQSAEHPNVITEASWNNGWNTSLLQ